MVDFIFSQDFGKVNDYQSEVLTEIVMKSSKQERIIRDVHTVRNSSQEVLYPELHVRWIDRKQCNYAQLVKETKMRLADPQIINRVDHVVDITGVGMGVVDFMRDENLSPIGVYCTSGNQVGKKDYGYTVPKEELVTFTQIVIARGLLKFSRGLKPDVVKQLIHEVQNFKEKKTKSNNTTYEALREQDHDDVLFALMLNCWWALKTHGHSINVIKNRRQPGDHSPYDRLYN